MVGVAFLGVVTMVAVSGHLVGSGRSLHPQLLGVVWCSAAAAVVVA